MTQETTVIYNGSCPICSREVDAYRREAGRHGAPLRFEDLGTADLVRHGLDADTAARRLHVVQDGRLLSGVDAFAVVWETLPRWRWLARLVRMPVIGPAARLGYDRAAAPLLYALHRRRQRRAGLSNSA